MKENGRRERARLLAQPTKGQGRKEDENMPPAHDDDAVRKGEEDRGEKEGLSHLDAEEGKTIIKDLGKPPLDVTPKEKLLGKGHQKEMEDEGA